MKHQRGVKWITETCGSREVCNEQTVSVGRMKDTLSVMMVIHGDNEGILHSCEKIRAEHKTDGKGPLKQASVLSWMS